jgi:hypothetical protein
MALQGQRPRCLGVVEVSERVGVVGNRKGADLESVAAFIRSLYTSQPDSVLVSGGCSRVVGGREQSVDAFAENAWYKLGGRARSYRPAPYEGGYGVEIWNYGGSEVSHVLGVEHQRVSFKDYKSAALYRDWMLAEDVDRLVAFYRDRMAKHASGAAFTASLAKDRKIPVYDFVKESDAKCVA